MKEKLHIGINMINSNTTLRGTDRYITEILSHLARIDNTNQYFVFYAHWQTFVNPLNAANFTFVPLSPPKGIFPRGIWQALVFPRIVKEYALDVLHYTNPVPIMQHACPVAVTIHDLAEFIFPEKYGKLKSYGKRFSVFLSVKNAACIIAVSESTKKTLVDLLHCNPDSIEITREGVGIPAGDKDCEYINAKYRLPANYILYVGVIEKTKRIELMIKAFSLMDDSLKNTHAIVIAGNKGNAYGDVMATIKECNLDERVHFLGYVPDDDLRCIYKHAKIFVFPSLIEGFGLPLLEAMGNGVPVIASRIPVIEEIVGDAAILVNAHDIESLSAAMKNVLIDADLQEEFTRKGLERVTMFSWDITAERTLAIYKKMADTRDRRIH